MRFFTYSVAYLLIIAGVAVLTGCIPFTQHRGAETYVERARTFQREFADVNRVRAELGDPRDVQSKPDGGQRLEYYVPTTRRAVFLTLCGVVPMQEWSPDARQLFLDVDRNGYVRDYRLQ